MRRSVGARFEQHLILSSQVVMNGCHENHGPLTWFRNESSTRRRTCDEVKALDTVCNQTFSKALVIKTPGDQVVLNSLFQRQCLRARQPSLFNTTRIVQSHEMHLGIAPQLPLPAKASTPGTL